MGSAGSNIACAAPEGCDYRIVLPHQAAPDGSAALFQASESLTTSKTGTGLEKRKLTVRFEGDTQAEVQPLPAAAGEPQSPEVPRTWWGQARSSVAVAAEEAAAAAKARAAPIVRAGEFVRRWVHGALDDTQTWDDQLDTEGQKHIWAFQDHLSKRQLESLRTQAEAYDERALADAFRSAVHRRAWLAQDLRFEPPTHLSWTLKLPPRLVDGANISSLQDARPLQVVSWRNVGLDLLEQGRVGVVLLAGGDGTRAQGGPCEGAFGYSPSVPTLDIGLLSKKSLFQIYCERLRRLEHMVFRRRVHTAEALIAQDPREAQRRGFLNSSGRPVRPKIYSIPLYVMVSEANRHEVEAFWHQNRHFGLHEKDVFFFQQAQWPVVSPSGKVLMSSPSHLILRPGGSGGLLPALKSEGAWADMRSRAVEAVFVMGCNNVLARVADPVFLGYCSSAGSHDHRVDGEDVVQEAMPLSVGIKTIERVSGDERLGLYVTQVDEVGDASGRANLGGPVVRKRRPSILEFYEADEELKNRAAVDKIHYYCFAGDLCQYYLRLDEQMDQATKAMDWRAIDTWMPYYSHRSHRLVEPPPDVCNAVRLEQTVAGVLAYTTRALALHVDRFAEYAPIHTPEDMAVAVQVLGMLHQAWICEAGGMFERSRCASAKKDQRCEISPLVSYAGEDLNGCFPTGADGAPQSIPLPVHFQSNVENQEAPVSYRPVKVSTKEHHLKYAPWASLSDAQVAAATQDAAPPTKKIGEEADAEERLPETPRWLREEETDWESKVKKDMSALERRAELDALASAHRWMDRRELEAMFEKFEREQVEALQLLEGTGRRERTRTAPTRPYKTQAEKHGAVTYGIARYYAPPAGGVRGGGATQSLERLQQAPQRRTSVVDEVRERRPSVAQGWERRPSVDAGEDWRTGLDQGRGRRTSVVQGAGRRTSVAAVQARRTSVAAVQATRRTNMA